MFFLQIFRAPCELQVLFDDVNHTFYYANIRCHSLLEVQYESIDWFFVKLTSRLVKAENLICETGSRICVCKKKLGRRGSHAKPISQKYYILLQSSTTMIVKLLCYRENSKEVCNRHYEEMMSKETCEKFLTVDLKMKKNARIIGKFLEKIFYTRARAVCAVVAFIAL